MTVGCSHPFWTFIEELSSDLEPLDVLGHSATKCTTCRCAGLRMVDRVWVRISWQKTPGVMQSNEPKRVPGERGRTRTCDPCLKRALLYQLSYAPTFLQSNTLIPAGGYFGPPLAEIAFRCRPDNVSVFSRESTAQTRRRLLVIHAHAKLQLFCLQFRPVGSRSCAIGIDRAVGLIHRSLVRADVLVGVLIADFILQAGLRIHVRVIVQGPPRSDVRGGRRMRPVLPRGWAMQPLVCNIFWQNSATYFLSHRISYCFQLSA